MKSGSVSLLHANVSCCWAYAELVAAAGAERL